MGLRVKNIFIIAITAQRHLGTVSQRLAGKLARLSGGPRVTPAATDAAGHGISERTRSQIGSLGQLERNGQDGIRLAQTAEGAMNGISGHLSRMRELALQSVNGTLDDADRAIIDVESQALIEEIERIATSTTFNGISLSGGGGDVDIQVGPDSGETLASEENDVTAAGLGLSGLAVGLAASANADPAAIDTAINTAIGEVIEPRGNLGPEQTRRSSKCSIQGPREMLCAAESRIRDVKVASEAADLTRIATLQRAAVSVVSQAEAQPQLALNLLG